jgi:kynurenine formamidase
MEFIGMGAIGIAPASDPVLRFPQKRQEAEMSFIRESSSGLSFCELSHSFGHGVPVWPGDDDVRIWKSVYHAKHGVLSQKLAMNMHCSTHLTAPVHLIQGGAFVAEIPPEVFFGVGVVLRIPKNRWELVVPADLERCASVEAGDIVIINTGWHHKYSDSQEYFGDAPGLSPEAADWLVGRGVKLVGVDTAAVDHPLATSLGLHRNGPAMKHLPDRYHKITKRDPRTDFPDWNPAHKRLLAAGIPTLQNVGGDLEALGTSRAVFHAMPWKWLEGEACVVRLVAILDPTGSYRIESGAAQ